MWNAHQTSLYTSHVNKTNNEVSQELSSVWPDWLRHSQKCHSQRVKITHKHSPRAECSSCTRLACHQYHFTAFAKGKKIARLRQESWRKRERPEDRCAFINIHPFVSICAKNAKVAAAVVITQLFNFLLRSSRALCICIMLTESASRKSSSRRLSVSFLHNNRKRRRFWPKCLPFHLEALWLTS